MLAICSFRPAETTWKCPSLCTCILRKIQFGLDDGLLRFSYIFMGAFGPRIATRAAGFIAREAVSSYIDLGRSEGPFVIRSHLTFRSPRKKGNSEISVQETRGEEVGREEVREKEWKKKE